MVGRSGAFGTVAFPDRSQVPELALGLAALAAWPVTPVVVRDLRAIPVVGVVLAAAVLSRSSVPVARWVGDRALALGLCWTAQILLAYATIAWAPWGGPLADAWLGAPERWTGLDYHAVTWGLPVLRAVYQSPDVVLMGIALASPSTLRRITRAFALCGLVGLAASLLLPALGAGPEQPWVPVLVAARAGIPLVLTGMPGVVSAPSFHAVGGTLVAASAWPTRWRGLAVVWWVATLVSALVVGGHYAVDVVTGVALAAWAWRWTDNRGQPCAAEEG